MKTIIISDHKKMINAHPISKLNPHIITNSDLMSGRGENLMEFDFIIDTHFEQYSYRIEEYDSLDESQLLLLSCPTETLHGLFNEYESTCGAMIFGFNALPYFFQRNLWEISCLNDGFNDNLAEIMSVTDLSIRFVKDQHGLVSFRTIATIINEAYFMLQEGSASAPDIDQAMKLGVNYPKGPFEWVNEIGIEHVYELLHKLKVNVSSETYKIAPALHQAFQKQQLIRP